MVVATVEVARAAEVKVVITAEADRVAARVVVMEAAYTKQMSKWEHRHIRSQCHSTEPLL